MHVKLLSGEIITLPTDSEEEFKKLYLETYVSPEQRPWVRISLQDGCLLVNTYTLLPRVEEWLMTHGEWKGLCKNPEAVDFLLRFPEKIDWKTLSLNPGAVEVLKENVDKISWGCLSCNPAAEELFRMYPDKVSWGIVAQNHPNARALLDEFRKDYYNRMFLNPHIQPEWVEDLPIWNSSEWPLPDIVARRPAMMPTIKKYYSLVKRRHMALFHLSANPAAWEWLQQHPEDIISYTLVWNTSPEVNVKGGQVKSCYPALVEYLKENPELIEPNQLLGNTRALDLIDEYADQITRWDDLVYNEAAGELIVKYIDRIPLTQELLARECIVFKG